jgi:hypothetical protein
VKDYEYITNASEEDIDRWFRREFPNSKEVLSTQSKRVKLAGNLVKMMQEVNNRLRRGKRCIKKRLSQKKKG